MMLESFIIRLAFGRLYLMDIYARLAHLPSSTLHLIMWMPLVRLYSVAPDIAVSAL